MPMPFGPIPGIEDMLPQQPAMPGEEELAEAVLSEAPEPEEDEETIEAKNESTRLGLGISLSSDEVEAFRQAYADETAALHDLSEKTQNKLKARR